MFEMSKTKLYASGTDDPVMLSQRGREYSALSKVTCMMQNHKNNTFGNITNLLIALNKNLKLWTIFASDVGQEKNGLPQNIKSIIFYLFEFTQAETHKIIRGEGDIEALIEINKSVMKGLRGAEG